MNDDALQRPQMVTASIAAITQEQASGRNDIVDVDGRVVQRAARTHRHFLTEMARAPRRHWRLVHGSSGATVVGQLHAAFDSAARRTGLLGHEAWPAGEGLVIAPCQAVHTVGMRFAIDVLFVRRDGTVEKVGHNVRPWRIAGAWRSFAVIEVAAGTLAACRPQVVPGDRVTVEPGD